MLKNLISQVAAERISKAIGTLPFVCKNVSNETRYLAERLLDTEIGGRTAFYFKASLAYDLLVSGCAYLLKYQTDIQYLPASGVIALDVGGETLYMDVRDRKLYKSRRLIAIESPFGNQNIIKKYPITFEAGLEAEKMVLNLASREGGVKIIIEDPEDELGENATNRDYVRSELRGALSTDGSSVSVGILPAGLKHHQVQTTQADAADVVDKRTFRDSALLMGVPPAMIDGVGYSAEVNMFFNQNCVIPTAVFIGEAITNGLRTMTGDRVISVAFDTSELLRGDDDKRGSYYWRMYTMGAINAHTIAQKEGLPEPGTAESKTFFRPANMFPSSDMESYSEAPVSMDAQKVMDTQGYKTKRKARKRRRK